MDRANGGGGPGAAANRAERFEEEKRRIIDSCFNKKDVDGSLLETYITHIRITEFSSHPSSPPPPQARTPEVQKPRVIIVAVRKSGRVRMHKSKENANGTFSIGKTWNLDDLTQIEAFSGPNVNPSHREWVGETGFVVNLGKTYYWQSQTDKERKFFIASLIKIYSKYTGGKYPELKGFDPRELEQVMGAGRRPAAAGASRPPPPSQPPQADKQGPSQPNTAPSPRSAPPVPPVPSGPPLRGNPENPRFARTPPARPPINGTGSPAGSVDSGASKGALQPPWMAQSNKSQDSVAGSITGRSDDGSSIPPRSRNGMPGPGAFGRFADPPSPRSGPQQQPPPQQPPPQQPPPQLRPQAFQQPDRPPPERRRPPMDPTRPHDRDLVPPPLLSPAKRPDPVAPPPRSTERDRMGSRQDSSSNKSLAPSLPESFRERDRDISTPPSRGTPDVDPSPKTSANASPRTMFAQPTPSLKAPSATSLSGYANHSSSPSPTNISAPAPFLPPEPRAVPSSLSPGMSPGVSPGASPGVSPGASPGAPPSGFQSAPPRDVSPGTYGGVSPGVSPGASPGAPPSAFPGASQGGISPGVSPGASPRAPPRAFPAAAASRGISPGGFHSGSPGSISPGASPGAPPSAFPGAAPGPSPGISPGASPGNSRAASPAISRSVPPARPKPESPAPAPTPPPVRPPVESPEPSETPQRDDSDEASDSEEARPGLGPMIKAKKSKGEIAGALWKAASAASAAGAFKPRRGGAGERLRQLQSKGEEGPDGITGVVPAPSRAPDAPKESTKDSPQNAPATPEPPKITAKSPHRNSLVPEVKVSVPSRPNSSHGPVEEVKKTKQAEKAEKADARRRFNAGNDVKYFQSLGIDSTVLDDRSEEFCKWLDHFGWIPGEQMRTNQIEDMQVELERELNKAQAGGWLARFREEDERVDAIKLGIDVAIAECEELDNLLTLYSVELSTLQDDITYIEAQGQGLQVQTANQKLLKKELESLLETCSITTFDLNALRVAPLDTTRGLAEVEAALITLFKAMMKIDPTLSGEQGKDITLDSDQTGFNMDYGQMRIVREKKETYMQESTYFVRRLIEFMTKQYDAAFNQTKLAMEGALSRKVDSNHHDLGRDVLWKYHPLMLYARDVDLENWNRMIQIYQDKSQPVYRVEFQNVVAIWRKNARKLTGEEAELLFSTQNEKHHQESGVANTARKLTVKRSQTLARALRSPREDGSHGRTAPVEKASSDSRSLPYEVFAGVMDDLLPLVQMEQNFIVDFFHATTLEQVDFPDSVGSCEPQDRRGGDLKRPRLMEPDRDLARRITRAMEVIFAFLESELQRLVEWVTAQDPLQGVGILTSLEGKLGQISQSNQDFLNALIQKLHGHLEGKFKKFVDEQIRAIEETKVKINKRKGVISFIRVFPLFSAAVENMVPNDDPNLSTRRTIDREYDRILKTMFDSLMVIARENPAVSVTSGSADPEDKEALNFHILLIENMNHFLEETDTKGLEVLEEWKDQGNAIYHEHMDLYLNAVMRRPLGKVLEHLENMEAQLQSGKSPASIAAQPSNNKTVFNKVLGNYDSKEIRKGIEALRKRVEKHFGDADDPALSRGLVIKVLTECERFYEDVETRIGRVTTDVYGGDVLFEWPRADVKAAFR